MAKQISIDDQQFRCCFNPMKLKFLRFGEKTSLQWLQTKKLLHTFYLKQSGKMWPDWQTLQHCYLLRDKFLEKKSKNKWTTPWVTLVCYEGELSWWTHDATRGVVDLFFISKLEKVQLFRIFLLEAGSNDQPDSRIAVPLLGGTLFRTAHDWEFTAYAPSLNEENLTRVRNAKKIL